MNFCFDILNLQKVKYFVLYREDIFESKQVLLLICEFLSEHELV